MINNDFDNISDRRNLAKLFAALGYTVGAEIGVWKGWYSRVLLSNNPNLKLYCIDSWMPYDEIQSLRKLESYYQEAKRKLLNYNAIIIRKTSLEALADIGDESLDFVYIDAAHDYENVFRDVSGWYHKVRQGGIVSGHDYDFEHRYDHLAGAVKAIDDYTAINEIKFRLTKDYPPSWFFIKEQ